MLTRLCVPCHCSQEVIERALHTLESLFQTQRERGHFLRANAAIARARRPAGLGIYSTRMSPRSCQRVASVLALKRMTLASRRMRRFTVLIPPVLRCGRWLHGSSASPPDPRPGRGRPSPGATSHSASGTHALTHPGSSPKALGRSSKPAGSSLELSFGLYLILASLPYPSSKAFYGLLSNRFSVFKT
jgi:hypothetical protein